ncbi:globin domain-containing protein [Kitasatospora sp. NPDC051914]|uniref:globin domain-containing protein n=1 Tax=Kitasatospora sp. NPDC051914 TaxID=3154945 RepID=UPI00344445CF
MEITSRTEYDSLLARHDAMRLRRQILAPAVSTPTLPPAQRAGYGHDARADQEMILRHLDAVTPFDLLIEHLYDFMFLRRPYLRRLFPESMEFQREHLGRMFRYLIDNLHRPDHMSAVLQQLGRDHRKLGVWPAHYDAFEEALCSALRSLAGRAWSADAEGAWLRMLRFAVGEMVAAAESALTEPPYWLGVVTAHQPCGPDVAVLQVRTGEPYPYRAGQYATVESALLPHTWRPYSIACAPRADNVLEFHVRRSGTGGVSAALVDGTAVGDTLRLGPPRGAMTVDVDDDPRDLLLVAHGTGLAPMKALVEDLSERRVRGQRVHLLVGARDRADLYGWDALVDLGVRRPWLELVPVLGHEARPGGALCAALAGSDWSGHLAFVGGPPAVVETVQGHLFAAGVPGDRIRHDPLPAAGRG